MRVAFVSTVFVFAALGCDTPSNLSTGVEQPPKSQFAQSPTTLPTNPSEPVPATPRMDDPGDTPAEDPAAGGSSHTPRTLDTNGALTTDAAAAAASANPN